VSVEVSRVYVPRAGLFLVNVKLDTDGPPRHTPETAIARLFMGVPGVKSARPALEGSSVWEISVYAGFDDHRRGMLGQVAQAIADKEDA
jgi:hypothetical protein